MTRNRAFAFLLTALTTVGCAGTLDDPSSFDQGVGTSEGDNDDNGDTDDSDEEAADGSAGGGDGSAGGGDGSAGGGDGSAGGGDGSASADGSAGGGGGGGAVTCDFNALIATCTGCHSAASPSGGLDLESADLESRLANADAGTPCGDNGKLAVPGSAATSVIYQRITGECSQKPYHDRDGAQVACLESWINSL